jgi:hypothetical protein
MKTLSVERISLAEKTDVGISVNKPSAQVLYPGIRVSRLPQFNREGFLTASSVALLNALK